MATQLYYHSVGSIVFPTGETSVNEHNTGTILITKNTNNTGEVDVDSEVWNQASGSSPQHKKNAKIEKCANTHP